MNIKLLTEHYLGFLSYKDVCTGSSESTLVKMPHFRKSHGAVHFHFSKVQEVMNAIFSFQSNAVAKC